MTPFTPQQDKMTISSTDSLTTTHDPHQTPPSIQNPYQPTNHPPHLDPPSFHPSGHGYSHNNNHQPHNHHHQTCQMQQQLALLPPQSPLGQPHASPKTAKCLQDHLAQCQITFHTTRLCSMESSSPSHTRHWCQLNFSPRNQCRMNQNTPMQNPTNSPQHHWPSFYIHHHQLRNINTTPPTRWHITSPCRRLGIQNCNQWTRQIWTRQVVLPRTSGKRQSMIHYSVRISSRRQPKT